MSKNKMNNNELAISLVKTDLLRKYVVNETPSDIEDFHLLVSNNDSTLYGSVFVCSNMDNRGTFVLEKGLNIKKLLEANKFYFAFVDLTIPKDEKIYYISAKKLLDLNIERDPTMKKEKAHWLTANPKLSYHATSNDLTSLELV